MALNRQLCATRASEVTPSAIAEPFRSFAIRGMVQMIAARLQKEMNEFIIINGREMTDREQQDALTLIGSVAELEAYNQKNALVFYTVGAPLRNIVSVSPKEVRKFLATDDGREEVAALAKAFKFSAAGIKALILGAIGETPLTGAALELATRIQRETQSAILSAALPSAVEVASDGATETAQNDEAQQAVA